jgi:TPP-dependent pyruvate/acetoin dehydrogenase alpha subunit
MGFVFVGVFLLPIIIIIMNILYRMSGVTGKRTPRDTFQRLGTGFFLTSRIIV